MVRTENIIQYSYVNNNILRKDSHFFYINRAGIIEVSSDFQKSRNNYPYSIIHFIMNGSGKVRFKNKEYLLGEGQSFILSPYDNHEYMTDPDNPWELLWIEFAGGDSAKLVNTICSSGNIVFSPPFSLKIKKYLLRIIRILQKNNPANQHIIAKLLFSLLLDIHSTAAAGALKKVSIHNKIMIERITDFISVNLEREISINELSDLANLSPFYFSRLFHELVGCAPARYILGQRISRAKELLACSDLKVGVIAEKLGFCHTSHFAAAFKKIEGVNPTDFRNQCIIYRASRN